MIVLTRSSSTSKKTEACNTAIVLKRASRYRCVPKIASPENADFLLLLGTTETWRATVRGTVRATVRATGGRILDFATLQPPCVRRRKFENPQSKLVGKMLYF